MIQVKSFIVKGETTTRNGVKIKDIADNVDREVNKFLENLEGELVDIKLNTEFVGASGDYCFVTVLYRAEKAATKKK